MKDVFAAIVTAGLAILAVLSVFLVSALRDKRQGQEQNQQLAKRVQTLEERVATLSEATNALASQLAIAQQAAVSNANALAQSVAAAQPPPNGSIEAPGLKPYRVQVYLGQEPIGSAWAIPSNVQRDPKTDRVYFDQIVRLPERARAALTPGVTNVIEYPVPVASPPVVQQEIYVDRRLPWNGWAPAGLVIPPGRPKPPPERPGRPVASRPSYPAVGGGPWTPVSIAPRPSPSRGLFVPPAVGSSGIFVPPGLR